MAELPRADGETPSQENLRVLTDFVLKAGPRAVKKVKTLLIDRHRDGSFKKARIVLFLEKRLPRSSTWYVEREFSLEDEEIQRLHGFLAALPGQTGVDTGESFTIGSSGETENGDITREQGQLVNALESAAASGRTKQMLRSMHLSTEALQSVAAAARSLAYSDILGNFESTIATGTLADIKQWIRQNIWVLGAECVFLPISRRVGRHSHLDLVFESVDGYYNIVEVCSPHTDALAQDPLLGHWYLGADVTTVLSQVATYLQDMGGPISQLLKADAVTVLQTRVWIIIGRSTHWEDDQKKALRAINKQLAGINVVTYDELLARGHSAVRLNSAKAASSQQADRSGKN